MDPAGSDGIDMTQRSARAGDAPASDDRPTIVFLHGTRLTGASWAPQLAELGGEFHCLTPDLPGHGTAADEPIREAAE